MIKNLEELMYQVSDVFLAPVLILLIMLFIYSLFALGEFLCMSWQRKSNVRKLENLGKSGSKVQSSQFSGYPLIIAWLKKPFITNDELDVIALEHLDMTRSVSRLAPMLGLIATMVPMGPALKSLANGNVQGISENLIVAFSAVIFGLVIAAITFWIASIKKRWLAKELVTIAAVRYEGREVEEVRREAA